MSSEIFKNCSWLTYPGMDAVLTRTAFCCNDIKEATLYITALGYFEAYINGKRVSDEHFIPAMTDYEKRDLSKIHMPIFDTLSHRIYYYKYDITSSLTDSSNILAAHIGAGWYGQHESPNEGMPYWGDNTLVFSIKLTDNNGNVTFINSSSDNTKWRKSYILETSLYYGEYHDARLYPIGWKTAEFDDSSWENSKVRTPPETVLEQCFFPSDKVIRTIEPKVIYEFGDTKIYDIGELAAGYAVLVFDENARNNERATLRYADELNEDGSLQFHYCGGTSRMQRDHFVYDMNAKDQEFHPHFTWHAARYIEVTGICHIKEYRVIQTDIKKISDFTCDNETLQWIFDAYVKTQNANIHGCIPSDCPHRERLGYTGDGQLTCGAVMSVFDAREMYKKWMADIRDCQDKVGGHVQHTAPFYGGGGGPGGWGGAACIVPYRYYKFYNDISILEESYDSMKAYLKYMINHCEDGIVTSEEPGGWCLGDWCPLGNKVTIPEAFVNTYFLTKCAEMTAETAEILGITDEVTFYNELSEKCKKAIIRHFYDQATGSFCEGKQGADAFALDIGLGDERTRNNFINKYSSLLTFDTGIFGTDLVIRMLFSLGKGDIAFKLLINEEITSFYNMKKHGATTLWENWDGCDSRCHPMFGAIVEYFFSDILGIKRLEDKAGYKEITINPANIAELKNVKGTMRTKWGDITVDISTDSKGNRNIKTEVTGEITIK
ncbi:MAG: family 78 glycoside hydrolase catalytic domain [Clostridia bacterium]|nr:family 78 glycoside hydrolase catalytic domain [Clostridia bacterium]